MSGYMEPDARQEWRHASRQVAETVAILRDALVEAGIPDAVASEMAVIHFSSILRADPMAVVKQIIEGQG